MPACCRTDTFGQVFTIRIPSLITPKFVVAVKIAAYSVPVMYHWKLAYVQDGGRGWYTFVMHILWILMLDRCGHVREPD